MIYPFQPAILDAMPTALQRRFGDLELYLLKQICERIKASGQLNQSAIEMIKALRSHGISLDDIKKAISTCLKLANNDVDNLLNDVVARNLQYYRQFTTALQLTDPEDWVSQADIDRIKAQTKGTFTNLTQSMGFVDNFGRVTNVGAIYQHVLDVAELQIKSGAISYNTAIYNAVKELADGGLKTVDYASGHVDQLDVAVRRAVMTGVSQLCDKYTVQAAERLQTDLFEVSAHRGARDTGTGPANHKAWQGKVYTTDPNNTKYPNIYTVCGLGTGEGLEGWNCRHRRFPFIEGISEPTYTQEQLDNIDPPPFKFMDKEYTCYEATQKQRQIERTIRKLKRRYVAMDAAGMKDEALPVSIKIKQLEGLYKEFSKVADLPMQKERANAYQMTPKQFTDMEKLVNR